MNFYTFLVNMFGFDDEKARATIQAIRRIYKLEELRTYYNPSDPDHRRPTESTINREGPSFWHLVGLWQGYAKKNDVTLEEPPPEDFQLLS